VWVLPLAWALPRVARRTLILLCVGFTMTELVTETSNLPAFIQQIRLPIGHPVAVAVCVWLAVDLVRRLRRGIPLDAETPERVFGDAFEAGPRASSADETAPERLPAGGIAAVRLARRR
jgi:hypothetical protein